MGMFLPKTKKLNCFKVLTKYLLLFADRYNIKSFQKMEASLFMSFLFVFLGLFIA